MESMPDSATSAGGAGVVGSGGGGGVVVTVDVTASATFSAVTLVDELPLYSLKRPESSLPAAAAAAALAFRRVDDDVQVGVGGANAWVLAASIERIATEGRERRIVVVSN